MNKEELIRSLRCCAPANDAAEPDCAGCAMLQDASMGGAWCSLHLMRLAADELERERT